MCEKCYEIIVQTTITDVTQSFDSFVFFCSVRNHFHFSVLLCRNNGWLLSRFVRVISAGKCSICETEYCHRCSIQHWKITFWLSIATEARETIREKDLMSFDQRMASPVWTLSSENSFLFDFYNLKRKTIEKLPLMSCLEIEWRVKRLTSSDKRKKKRIQKQAFIPATTKCKNKIFCHTNARHTHGQHFGR